MPNNQNNIELLVKLGIDKSNKTDLQTQVDTLGKSLAGLKVDIKIDPSAIKALEKLSTMDFSKLAGSVKKATEEVSKSTVKSAEEAEKIMRETFGNKIPKAIEKGFSGTANDIKKQFKSMGFENIKVGFDVKNGKQQMDKLVASVEREGVTKTVHFKQATVSSNGRDSALWMPDKVIDNDKSLSLAAKNVDQLIAKMNKLQTEGKLTNTQFEHLTNSIKNIDKQGGIKGLNAQLDQFVVNNKKATEAVRATERAQKEQAAELKRQEDAQKRIIENEIKRKNLVLDIERAMKSQSRSIDQTAARNLIDQTRQLDVTSKNFSTSLKQNQSALRELNTNAAEATRSNMGLISSFKTAMEKFPIWMAASTVFYSITRGATDLTRKVIELDTALVNMQRVMDMPSYKFNDMLEQSMVNVENLSGKLSDYLNLVTEFGRMGFDSAEALDMSNTAQMLANISDLKSDESVSSLVAAMTAFNITAEDSIDIADKLNEVDNQYSITTKDLALSMNKSASTAKVFGASLDQLLGYTTAIGAATRESGNVVGNSLKSIMSRIMTLPRAATALSEIGISIKDMGGEVRPVADIIDELGRKWNTLSAAEQQNTAIKVAGTNQLGRFNALMLNYQTAVDATTTSINSQGSATREQEKYNRSLEARINRLSTAWYGLADSVGQSILYDGIVVLTSAFEGAAKTGESAVMSFGALPIMFGVLGSSVALLSTRFSTWTGTMIANRATALAATATNGSLSASLLTVAATSTVAQRALMMTGVGIGLVAVAGAVTLLTSAVSKHIQEQEEFDLYLKNNTDALGVNKEATKELITQYNKLTNAKENGSWDSEKEEEYLAVQQKLGEFFPALIKSIDSTGQSHIKNKEAIEAEIKATEDLIKAQNDSIIENSDKEFKKLNEELNGSWYDSFSNYIYGSLEARIKEQKKILEAMNKNGSDEGAIAEQVLKLKQLERQSQQTSEEIKGHVFTVADAMNDIDINSDLSGMLQEFVGGLDLSKLDDTGLKAFAKEIGSIQQDLQEAFNDGNTEAFDSIIKQLNELAKTTDGFDSKYGKLAATVEDGNIVLTDTAGIVHVLGENTEEAAEQTDLLAEAFGNAVSNISSLNSIVNELNEGNGLTAKSMQTMMEKYPQLLSYIDNEALLRIKIAELIGKEEEAAKQAMIAKLSTSKEAYQKMYKDNKAYFDALSKEYGTDFANFKNLAQAKVEAENAVMNKLSQNWSKYYSAQANALTKQGEAYFKNMSYGEAVATGNGSYGGEDAEFLRQFSKAKDAARGIAEAFNDMAFTSFSVDNLGLSMEGLTDSTKGATKASKDAAKATEKSTYLADKYKQALEAVNAEIEKQNILQSKHPDYSKEYRDSLQKEIALEKQKTKLMQDQAVALENQIKSGKIVQTGIVTTKSGGATTKTTSSGGSYSGKYSSEINAAASRHGVDPNLIAAIIKQESGFNPNATSRSGARGLMQLMPGTASGLGVKNSFDPAQNIDGGTKYIAQQLKKFSGNIEKALIAYNAGPGNVSKVLNSSAGQWKEPKNYVKKVTANYAANKGSSGTTTTTSDISDTSKDVAQAQQAIDQAKSELTSLQGSILQAQEAISNLELEVINSQLANYNKRHEDLQHNIDDEIQKRQKLDSVSQKYHDSIKNQISRTNIQIKNYETEKKYLEGLIKSTSITAKTKAELTERVKELSLAIVDLNIATKELTFERIQATMRRFDEQLDDVTHGISMSKARLDLLDEGSVAHTNEMKKQIPFLEKQGKLLREQEASLQRSLKIHDLTPEQIKQITEQMEDLSLSILDVESQTKHLRNTLNSQIADSLTKIKDEYLDGLKKESERATESIEKAIEDTEKYYDSLIEKQRERLDALDEEIEKEDRLKALREIDDEINKVKNDKRFSYIGADGKEILTYNKERVSELEKQRSEMIQQYQREDIKKAIQDEIDRLEKARKSKVETMRKELEDTKLHYQQLIESEETKWNGLIESAQNGTLGFSTIMNEFYGTSLTNLSKYASGIQSQIASIQAAFAALSEMKPPPVPSIPSVGTGVSHTKPATTLKKYHDGGIVGEKPSSRLSEIANKLFNTKPNEQVVKSLVGELQIPPNNIPNLFTNIQSMVGKLTPRQQTMQPAGDTITLHIDKVVADNPKQFMSDLDMYIRMNKH